MRTGPAIVVLSLFILSGLLTTEAPLADSKACFSKNEPELTVRACTALIESKGFGDNTLASIYFLRGSAYLLMSRWDLAEADAKEGLKRKPGDPLAILLLEGVATAKTSREKVLEQSKPYADVTSRILENPNDADAYIKRGSYYNLGQLYDQALADYTKAIELDAKGQNGSLAYAGRAEAYAGKRDYQHALDEVERAIAIDPSNFSAFFTRCTIFSKRNADFKDLALAVASYGAALELMPQDKYLDSVRLLLIKIRAEDEASAGLLGYRLDAIADYRSILRIDPSDANARLRLAALGGLATLDPASDACSDRPTFHASQERKDAAVKGCTTVINESGLTGASLAAAYHMRGLTKRTWDAEKDDALGDLTKAIELDPSNVFYLSDRAEWFEDKGDDKAARADLNRLVELAPKSPGAYIKRSELLSKMSLLDEARADLKRALELEPKGPAMHLLADLEKGSYASLALRSIECGLEKIDTQTDQEYVAKTIRDCTRAIDAWGIRSNNADPMLLAAMYRFRGIALKNNGDVEKAMADFDQAVRLNPKDPANYLGRLAIAIKKNDLDGVVANCTEHIKLAPNSDLCFDLRGAAYESVGRREEAKADYRRQLELHPDDSVTKERLAKLEAGGEAPRADQQTAAACFSSVDLDKAFRACTKLLDDGIGTPEIISAAYLKRGLIYAMRGDHAQSQSDLDEAVKRSPNPSDTYAMRGGALAQMGRNDEAFYDLTRAIDAGVQRTDTFQSRGMILVTRGDYEGAIKDLDGAVKLDRNFLPALQMRAQVLGHLKRFDEGIADANRAIELDPSAASYGTRAVVQELKGQLESARDDYQKALSLDPSDKFSKDRLAALTAARPPATPQLPQQEVIPTPPPDQRSPPPPGTSSSPGGGQFPEQLF